MKIASWNVNSLRTRLALVLKWLEDNQPDLLALQEIKCQDKDFPQADFKKAGWNVVFVGQKAYNGVAMISKKPVECKLRTLPKMKDEHSRFIEVMLDDVRVINIYAPNGNPLESEKFPYKLKWLETLFTYAQSLKAREEKIVITGDYNIIPTKNDVWDESKWLGDALYQPEIRGIWRKFIFNGWTDAISAILGTLHNYTFWDYQRGAWQKNHGIRIDHFLLSPQAADCLIAAGIDKEQRALEKPSDHVPLWIELD